MASTSFAPRMTRNSRPASGSDKYQQTVLCESFLQRPAVTLQQHSHLTANSFITSPLSNETNSFQRSIAFLCLEELQRKCSIESLVRSRSLLMPNSSRLFARI